MALTYFVNPLTNETGTTITTEVQPQRHSGWCSQILFTCWGNSTTSISKILFLKKSSTKDILSQASIKRCSVAWGYIGNPKFFGNNDFVKGRVDENTESHDSIVFCIQENISQKTKKKIYRPHWHGAIWTQNPFHTVWEAIVQCNHLVFI